MRHRTSAGTRSIEERIDAVNRRIASTGAEGKARPIT